MKPLATGAHKTSDGPGKEAWGTGDTGRWIGGAGVDTAAVAPLSGGGREGEEPCVAQR